MEAKIIAKRLIEQHEGLRLVPYKCSAGKLTIGYGHNLDDNGIDKTMAVHMLNEDVANTCFELDKYYWFNPLSTVRKAVMIDMCFNLGLPRFLKFKKMIAALNAGNYPLVANEMLDSKWAKQVGKRAEDLALMMRDNTG